MREISTPEDTRMLKAALERDSTPLSRREETASYEKFHFGQQPSFRPAPKLTDGQIHIWTLSHRHFSVSDYIPLLSTDELKRAADMRFPHLFDRFVADHGALRLLLSAYLETDPRSLQLVANMYGKPSLLLPNCRLRFNMSHSGGITVIAVCLGADLGVDVEAIRPLFEWEEIAASHFSPDERESIQNEQPDTQLDAFFRCWTRKEALIKAIGMGLSIPLDSFSVTTSLEEPPKLLRCTWNSDEASRWTLLHLGPAQGYVGALAVERRDWVISYFEWPIRTSH